MGALNDAVNEKWDFLVGKLSIIRWVGCGGRGEKVKEQAELPIILV